METANTVPFFLLSFFIFCFLALFSHAAIFDSITQGQLIRDDDRVVSHRLKFELGFFSSQDSRRRYVGIWYDVPGRSVIWVANRENPIEDREGAITISKDGNLVILDGKNNTVWSSNVSISIPRNKSSKAILRDDGNLILSSIANNRKLWQSFDHPTDTFLPGMILLVNETKGEVRSFVSWKSADDPSPGNYTMGLDPRAALQIVIWEGSKRRWRSGYWDGRIFTGVNMTSSYLYGFRLNVNDDQIRYLTYNPLNSSEKVRFQIGWDGTQRKIIWEEGQRKWITEEREPYNECEMYNKCGNFGVCRLSSSPTCKCLKGFEPKDWDQWQKGNWSGGCRRKTPLKNEIEASNGTDKNVGEDGFLMMKCLKLPDFVNLVASSNSGIDVATKNCKNHCVSHSNCTAYAYVNGIGCMIWHGELADIYHFENGGNMLFIRLAASELGSSSKKTMVVIIAAVMAGVICLGLCVWLACIFQRKRKASEGKNEDVPMFVTNKSRGSSVDVSGSTEFSLEGSNQLSGPELPFFNFHCIAIATNNFSEENKLGQGGFGPVYKGKLPGGEEIAVKRLSRCSGQGLEEFKNEMVLIAKLQHRNLVRLLGCSTQEEEKLLVYEYLPNKSLDCYLFDPDEQKKLDWKKRFEMIEGIARGILYLHRDSRLRIIHRDLKASNILLDENMNPKISDFGLARIFGGNQNEANTNRVVGTYGYMAPEYAMEGLFSMKSDVYSFGVLLLEIVSGRKNTSFRDKDGSSLIGHAWHLWNEERGMELVDPTIRDSVPRRKALRWIQIGMLCVQDCAGNRPSMSNVVLMLESATMALPSPKQPLLICMSSEDKHVHIEEPLDVSSNGLTITMALGR